MEAKITNTIILYLEMMTIQKFKRLTGLTEQNKKFWEELISLHKSFI
jgi:hypothetical protein